MAVRMQRLLEIIHLVQPTSQRALKLKKKKNFQSKYVALRSKAALVFFSLTTRSPFRSSLFFFFPSQRPLLPSKTPAQRDAFQGPVGGKPARHLVRQLKGVYLLGAGAMPSRTQWALDTMAFTD